MNKMVLRWDLKDKIRKINLIFDRIILCESHRGMIQFLRKNYNGQELVGVEIGTFGGDNAVNMLNLLKIKKLFLIDPYMECRPMFKFSQDEWDNIYAKAKRKVRLHDLSSERVVFIRKCSDKAVGDIPHDLDFVYIDGDHSREAVKLDIQLYYPKVKYGGVIGGHDYDAIFPSVCKVVNEFVEKENLILFGQHEGSDWWVVKK